MKCKYCRFAHVTYKYIECRRYAPAVYATQRWPEVYPHYWCGEFRPIVSSSVENLEKLNALRDKAYSGVDNEK